MHLNHALKLRNLISNLKKKGGNMKKSIFILLGCISALLISSQSFAETTMSQEGQYIFNSLGFYIGGVLVAFMAAGFCMLESGLVTTKSVSTIAAKNIGKFAICSLVFFLVGYNLAYGVPEGGYVGSFTIWTDSSDAETGYSGYSDWFFQTMFVCATASIVSGAVAERIKIWPFFIFAAIVDTLFVVTKPLSSIQKPAAMKATSTPPI